MNAMMSSRFRDATSEPDTANTTAARMEEMHEAKKLGRIDEARLQAW
jgi:hypothetical protein